MGYNLIQHRHVNLTAISGNHYPVCIEIFKFSSSKIILLLFRQLNKQLNISDIRKLMDSSFLKVLNLNFIQNFYITHGVLGLLPILCYLCPVLWCNPHCYRIQIIVLLKKKHRLHTKQHRTVFTWVLVFFSEAVIMSSETWT